MCDCVYVLYESYTLPQTHIFAVEGVIFVKIAPSYNVHDDDGRVAIIARCYDKRLYTHKQGVTKVKRSTSNFFILRLFENRVKAIF